MAFNCRLPLGKDILNLRYRNSCGNITDVGIFNWNYVAVGGVSEYCMENLLQAACSHLYETQILCISTVV